MSSSFRPFKAEDLSGVTKIEASSFPDPWPTSFFKYIHTKAPDLFIVAEGGDKIVGYVIGELREIMFSGVSHRSKVGHILNIAVDRRRRGKGIGAGLMSEIEEKFRGMGASQVTLEVRESNSTARSFYRGLGFTDIGRVRAYYPDEDAIIMSKNLGGEK
jgi:ribosomal-protein-alanine N-acetyltransferase